MTPESTPKATPWGSILVRAVAFILVVVLAAGLIRGIGVQLFAIPSDSMSPTLGPGERIAVWRPDAWAQPRRGDIVVVDGRGNFAGGMPPTNADEIAFWFGLGPSDVYYVKRVIGVGGDRVRCCDQHGRLTINGEPVDEPYLAAPTSPDAPASAIDFDVAVPDGRLWLMGDNRGHSADSRSLLGAPGGGMIPLDRLMGRATMVVLPPGAHRELARTPLA